MTAYQPFADRLLAAVEGKGSAAVIGLDPRLEWLPKAIREEGMREHGATSRGAARSIRDFCIRVIDRVEPFTAVVKPQIAFFEEHGGEGLHAYSDVVRHARERGLLVIGDAKRADIASTAEAYSRGHLGVTGDSPVSPRSPLEVDAVTINPYLGSDGIGPFLGPVRERGKGVFILCRTSNPSAREFQDLQVDTPGGVISRVHEIVARSIVTWGEGLRGESGYSSVGAVVGLSNDRELLSRLRSLLPQTIILVPGFGAQGGGEEDLVPLFDEEGRGVIVNSSRGVVFAFRGEGSDEGWEEAVEAAARDLRDSTNRARDAAGRRGR